MKKQFLKVLAALVVLPLAVPQASAIITDPDDYIIYDSGPLAPVGTLSSVPDTFRFEDATGIRLIPSERVTFKTRKYVLGRFMNTNEYKERLGILGQTVDSLSGLEVGQNSSAPYKYTKLEWKKKQNGCTVELQNGYRWWLNEADGSYNRPSDSLIIRVPYPCDSVYIEAGGTNNGYGLIVYQKDQGFDNGYYSGGNWGTGFYTISFRPVITEGQDSFDIVVLSPHKDWFVSLNNTRWKDAGSVTFTQVPLNTALEKYQEGERWGLWATTIVNRIKIYGQVESGEVPEFTGTHSAWDFKYLPKSSGTVNVDAVIKQTDGMKNTLYTKYASDLGVVRSMLTSANGYKVGYDDNLGQPMVRMENLSALSYVYDDKQVINGTDTTTVPEFNQSSTVAGAENYYEITAPLAGFQDITLSVTYAIDNFDTLVVAYSEYGTGEWKKFDTVAVPAKGTLQTLQVAVPADFNNLKTSIRILPWGTANGGKFSLAAISLDGFQDYYAKDDDAKKIAYINGCTDRIHTLANATTADTSDVFLKALMEGTAYDVKIFTQADWKDLTAETVEKAFKDYSVVILSDYVADDASIVTACQALVGKKPLLNFKTAAHLNYYANFVAADASADTASYTEVATSIHPLFTGSDVSTSNLKLPKLTGDSTCYFNGVSGQVGENAYVLAASLPSNTINIYEDFSTPKAKYMYMALPKQAYASVSKKCSTMLVNAIEYLNKSTAFQAPDFELTSDGAKVSTAEEFRSASAYSFSAINISSPVIYLNNSIDLGSEPVQVGSSSITYKPAADAVMLQGNFALAGEANSIAFKNIDFEPAQDQKSFVVIEGKKGIKGGIYFDNCSIANFEGAFIDAQKADSANLKVVSFSNCSISGNKGGLVAADGVVRVDSISVTNTIVENDESAALFLIAGQNYCADSAAVDTVRAFNMDHSLVYYPSVPNRAANLLKVTMSGLDGKSLHLTASNNIMYMVGQYGIALDASAKGTFASSYNLLADFQGATLPEGVVLTETGNYESLAALGVENVFDANRMISKLSPLFTAGADRTYLGPDFAYADRTESREVVVDNVADLKTAIEVAIGGDVIKLAKCTDNEYSIYELGSNGFTYPTTGGTLTITSADAEQPAKLFGRLAPAAGACSMDSLIYKNLYFTCDSIDMPLDSTGAYQLLTGYDKDAYAPFFMTGAVTAPYIEIANCSFVSLQNQYVMRTNNCEGAKMGKVYIHHCLMDNLGGYLADGKTGAHLVQFDKGDKIAYDLHTFVFEQNIVKDFHGSQMFNVTRQNSNDSVYTVTIQNNLFYRVGGNAKDSKRNFVEFSCAQENAVVNILIANNIFDQRWSSVNYPVCLLAVPDSGNVKAESKVQVLYNFYEGEYYTTAVSSGANPMALTDSPRQDNLLVSSETAIPVTYEGIMDYFTMRLDEEKLFEADSLIFCNPLSTDHPLYTAGLNGKYIGPACLYDAATALQKTASDLKAQARAYAKDGVIYVSSSDDTTVEVVNLLGQRVRKQSVKAGVSTIEGLPAGNVYVVRANGKAVKVQL